MKTYTIVEAELRNLWASSLMVAMLSFFATLAIGFAVNCWFTAMSLPANAHVSEQQATILKYGPKIGIITGIAFLLATAGAWWFGYSTVQNIRATSREGRVVS